MNHNFNLSIAIKYGVEEAIIIHNIYFWIMKNKANGKHFYDGEFWTYNSIEAFAELFPYWTRRQIERILRNAIEKGALKKGNYNAIAYDRTTWYAITETVKSIYANEEMESTKQGNGFTRTGEPIPDSKTDIKPNDKQYEEEIIFDSNFVKHDGLYFPKTHFDHSATFIKNKISLKTFMHNNKIHKIDDVKALLMEFNKHLNLKEIIYEESKYKDFKDHFINWHRRVSAELGSSLKSKKNGKLPDGVQPAEWLS